jgi:hypothetical protein
MRIGKAISISIMITNRNESEKLRFHRSLFQEVYPCHSLTQSTCPILVFSQKYTRWCCHSDLPLALLFGIPPGFYPNSDSFFQSMFKGCLCVKKRCVIEWNISVILLQQQWNLSATQNHSVYSQFIKVVDYL